MHYRLPSSEDRKYIHLRFAENGGPLTSQVAGRDVTPPAPSTPEYQIWYSEVKNELYPLVATSSFPARYRSCHCGHWKWIVLETTKTRYFGSVGTKP